MTDTSPQPISQNGDNSPDELKPEPLQTAFVAPKADKFELFSDRINAYPLREYLVDQWASLLSCFLSMAFIGCVAIALKLGTQAAILLMVVILVSWIIPLLISYLRERHFYQSAHITAITNPKPLLNDIVIGTPCTLSAKATHSLLEETLSRVRNDVALQRKNHEHYRTYIEQWIHEIKTPIAASKLLLDSMHGESAMTLKGELERIESQVELALYAARSTSLERDYTIREEPLLKLVQQACRTNMCLLINRKVALEFSINEDLCVLTDKQWCTFMISQIVVNAAKYDTTHLVFTAWEEDIDTIHGRTILEISDNGCGIPAADVPRVFEYGFVGEVGKAHGSATGMGLYLVGLMAGKLGCGVLLASEEGKGTRVRFSFPHDDRIKATPPVTRMEK